MFWVVALLNTVAALASMAFAVITLLRPNQFIPPGLQPQTDRFAAATYAARAVPLGCAVVAVVWVAPTGIAAALLLGVACVAQVGDVALALVHRVWGMATGAGAGVVFHALGVLAALGLVG
jgi:oxidoreductase, aldo/keto reductase family